MARYLISFDRGWMRFPEEDLPDDGPYPETKEVVGSFAVVGVPTRADAIAWAARIAVACRCAQEVREFIPDTRADEWLAR